MHLTGEEYKFKNRGPYCFRINGQVYHTISQMPPETGKSHFFHRYTFMINKMNLNRMASFSILEKKILKGLQKMMKEVNPYAKV